jgi:hypothetical protein
MGSTDQPPKHQIELIAQFNHSGDEIINGIPGLASPYSFS